MKEYLNNILSYDPESTFVFTHMSFWIFFAFVLLGNALLYKKSILRNTFLFICSLFFYYKAGGLYFGLLIFSTLVDYSLGYGIYKSKRLVLRKFLLIISLSINLGVLAYFKYTYFIADIVKQYINYNIDVTNIYAYFINTISNSNLDEKSILLPVGISFFTFQTISYSVDVYRGKIKAVTNIIDFGFYVSFFPQLVAGPIVRAWEFIPQLHKKYILSYNWFWKAVWLILTGLFKKMVISDYLSLNIVDRVFDAPMMHSGLELLLGAYAYTLQIYCDFSGYTDIAIGVALILGFRLPRNFNNPYKAKSISEFWRRWHISLSLWLRDYLYIPLGGNRKGKVRQSINLIITMLLGGLWHGASWMFVLWGFIHGIGLLLDKALTTLLKKIGLKTPQLLGTIFTFHFVVFTWIIFRAQDLDTFTLYIYRLLNSFWIYPVGEVLHTHAFAIILITFGFLLHWLPNSIERLIKFSFIKSHILIKLLIVILMSLIIYQFNLIEIKPFIYFRF